MHKVSKRKWKQKNQKYISNSARENNPPFPNDLTDEIKLADWLELKALLSDDKNSSRGDLERILKSSSSFDNSGIDGVEEKCIQVFLELEDREKSADIGYPFSVDVSSISLKGKIEDYISYIFCLCLSYYGVNPNKKIRSFKRKEILFPRRMFENLSCAAAKNFLDGEFLRFGWPRTSLPSNFSTNSQNYGKLSAGFKEAITEMCDKIGEGEGYNDLPDLSAKDDSLDVVAWKNLPDGKTSKLILFGQCASGNDWHDKLQELQPDTLWDQWMSKPKVSPLLRVFFIPHRIPRIRWDYTARYAGVFFERCRISYLIHKKNSTTLPRDYFNWCNNVLNLKP